MRKTLATAVALAALALPATAQAEATPTPRQVNTALAAVTTVDHAVLACNRLPAGTALARCVNLAVWSAYTPMRTLIYGLPAYCTHNAALARFENRATQLLVNATLSYMRPANKAYASASLTAWMSAYDAIDHSSGIRCGA